MNKIFPMIDGLIAGFQSQNLEIQKINIPISMTNQLGLEINKLLGESAPTLEDRVIRYIDPTRIGEYKGVILSANGSDVFAVFIKPEYRI